MLTPDVHTVLCVCSGHRMGNRFAEALAASLRRLNPPASHVFLRDNRLDSTGARRLLAGLDTSNLMVMDIGNNRVGYAGAAALANSLQVMRCMQAL